MAAGDKIRAKLDSLILGPIKDKQADIKKLIEMGIIIQVEQE